MTSQRPGSEVTRPPPDHLPPGSEMTRPSNDHLSPLPECDGREETLLRCPAIGTEAERERAMRHQGTSCQGESPHRSSTAPSLSLCHCSSLLLCRPALSAARSCHGRYDHVVLPHCHRPPRRFPPSARLPLSAQRSWRRRRLGPPVGRHVVVVAVRLRAHSCPGGGGGAPRRSSPLFPSPPSMPFSSPLGLGADNARLMADNVRLTNEVNLLRANNARLMQTLAAASNPSTAPNPSAPPPIPPHIAAYIRVSTDLGINSPN